MEFKENLSHTAWHTVLPLAPVVTLHPSSAESLLNKSIKFVPGLRALHRTALSLRCRAAAYFRRYAFPERPLKLLNFLIFVFAFANASANAGDEASMQDMLLVSKMTGACGVMQQMAAFQSSTEMPGGSEFIKRFWQTEFARLGKSQETFLKECEGSIAAYNQL
jgi:hypothetical protein